jgi:outer membrane protein TolC
MRNAVIAVVATIALAPAAWAQTPAPPPQAPAVTMEFDAVIRQALEKNPTAARAATNIARAETLLQQSRASILPFVTGSVINTTLDSERGFTGGVIQPQNQTTFGASVGMPVLAASRWAAVNQARDQVAVATATVAEVRQQIAVAAAQAYLAVIAARRQVEVGERAMESSRSHLEYAQKRFEGGAGSRLNQLRAASIVSTEEARVESARLGLRAAQEALGVLVVADGPVNAGAEPVFDQTGAFDENAWREARPDLVTQATIRRAAERVVADSWRDWVPDVTASFDPAYVTPSGLFAPSGTWRVSFVTNYSIFDGGQRRLAKQQRSITLQQATLTLTELEIQARSEVRLAQDSVRFRERALEAARRAAEQALEVVKITTTAFEVGATTNLEVIDAQRVARDAETAAAIAEDALRRARLDLLIALGRFK